MRRRWSDFLEGTTPHAHGVQAYTELDELAESVAAFLGAGLRDGSPAVLVVTPEHWASFADRLQEHGWDVAVLERQGLVVGADAEATLAAIMDGDRPSRRRFDAVVGALLDRAQAAAPGATVRAFGEMVDILRDRDRLDAAIALEQLWNDLAERRAFSLLCAYRLDIFDRAAQRDALPAVCAAHSHVLPAADLPRLNRAVELALDEVLGTRQAGHVYMLIGDDAREGTVPVAQLALMWVTANMPADADRILAEARRRYGAAAAY